MFLGLSHPSLATGENISNSLFLSLSFAPSLPTLQQTKLACFRRAPLILRDSYFALASRLPLFDNVEKKKKLSIQQARLKIHLGTNISLKYVLV